MTTPLMGIDMDGQDVIVTIRCNNCEDLFKVKFIRGALGGFTGGIDMDEWKKGTAHVLACLTEEHRCQEK